MHLGDAAERFTAAIARYVNAVLVAATARSEWEKVGRPMMVRYGNGTIGVDPRIQVMESHDRAGARYGRCVGSRAASERKLGRIGVSGRPVGAVSAPDRVARLGLAEPPRVVRKRKS